jgi:uncharacterized protein YuzE
MAPGSPGAIITLFLDFDAEGRVVAIEILDTKAHLSPGMDLAHLSAA